jgi:hypothetical protein
LTHRREILRQTSLKLPIDHGLIQATTAPRHGARERVSAGGVIRAGLGGQEKGGFPGPPIVCV